MKKIILGLSSVLMLCAVSCPSDSKPASLTYVDGEVVVKVPAEYKTVRVSNGETQQGMYAPSTVATLNDDNTALVFGNFALDDDEKTIKETVVLIGSKEELKDGASVDEQKAFYKKLKPISNTIKNILPSEMTLSTSAASASAIKIALDATDKKKVVLTTNAETVKVGDYGILIDGKKVTFTQDSTTKTTWTYTHGEVLTGKKASIFGGTVKGANYLKTDEVTL